MATRPHDDDDDAQRRHGLDNDELSPPTSDNSVDMPSATTTPNRSYTSDTSISANADGPRDVFILCCILNIFLLRFCFYFNVFTTT